MRVISNWQLVLAVRKKKQQQRFVAWLKWKFLTQSNFNVDLFIKQLLLSLFKKNSNYAARKSRKKKKKQTNQHEMLNDSEIRILRLHRLIELVSKSINVIDLT